MIKTTFHFFKNIQNTKHSILEVRIMGKAIPIKEKKAVLSGDTYHAGNDKKSRIMDVIVITTTSAFNIFCTIILSKLLFTSIK